MAKRDQVKERLEFWREEFNDWRELRPTEFKTWKQGIVEGGCKPMNRAAEYFGLDPADPTDSAVLLRILVDVVFGEPKKQGRKKGSGKWSTRKPYFRLGRRLHDLQAKRKSPMSDSEAARRLIELYPDEYGRDQWVTLRQRLPKAREVFARFIEGRRAIRTKSPAERRAELLRQLASYQEDIDFVWATPKGRFALRCTLEALKQADARIANSTVPALQD
jgi:hypothetical protein